MVEYDLLVLADDITGATDSGTRIARHGFDVRVVTKTDERPDSDVLVVDTDSRYATAKGAYRLVTDVATDVSAEVTYKKVDSTLRGNLLSETEAVIHATEPDIVVVAPAFPAAGRTTVDGTQYVSGTPIHESTYGRDAVDVGATSHLPTILSDLPRDVRSLGLDDIRDSDECLQSRLRSHAAEGAVVICDANEEADLAAIATASGNLDADIAYVGSGGLIAQIGWTEERGDGVTLAIVGSVSETTFTQLESLPEDHVVMLRPETLVDSDADGHDEVVDALKNDIGSPGYVVVTSAMSEEDIQQTLTAGRARGLSKGEIEDRVTATLGRTASAVARSERVTGFFITGGATYRAVLDCVDAASLSLPGIEVEAGVPLAVIDDGPLAGTPVISKAGGFGGANTIHNCIDFLCPR